MNNVTQSRSAEKNPDGKEKTVRRLCAVVIGPRTQNPQVQGSHVKMQRCCTLHTGDSGKWCCKTGFLRLTGLRSCMDTQLTLAFGKGQFCIIESHVMLIMVIF